jgi:exopolysaccharide production protein ExoQ
MNESVTIKLIKRLPILIILLLASGAFLGLMLGDSSDLLTTATHGDENLQWMWGIIDFAVVSVAFFHMRQLIRIASQQPWLIALLIWSILSAAWSADPELTLRRTLGLACTMLLGFFLGTRFEMKELLQMLAFVLVIVMLSSVITAILLPSFGVMADLDGAWRGVFTHKNVMSRIVGLGIIVFTCLLWETRRYRWGYVPLIFLGIVLIVLCKSMTAIIVTGLTLSLGAYRKLRPSPAQAVAVFAITLLLVLAGAVYLQGEADFVFASMGRDITLTGRTQLWELSSAAVLQRPLLGAGWDAFWSSSTADTIRHIIGWDAPHAHNGFLDISLNIGLIGLIIFLGALADFFRRAMRYGRQTGRQYRLWPLLFLSYMFFYLFTESPQLDRNTLFCIVYCAISVSMNIPAGNEGFSHFREGEFMFVGNLSNVAVMKELR